MTGKIRLYSANSQEETTVSNIFIDNYMPQANGEFVKIYLQLLRCIQHPCRECMVSSVADIADRFNHTETDVLRALKYWERQQLLSLDYLEDGSLAGICLLPLSAEGRELAGCSMAASSGTVNAKSAVPAASGSLFVPAADPSAPAVQSLASSSMPVSPDGQAASSAVLSAPLKERRPRQYSAGELTAFAENPEVQELFFIIQTYIRHTLSDTDTNLILFWYDELKFPSDLIEYLVEYCITKGHYSTSYMNKVALGWADAGIKTVDAAREQAAAHSQIYYAIMKALGIHGRNLVPAENEFIRRWTKDMGFSQELIEEACARTMAATHQPSFEYTDSILSRWKESKVTTMEEVKQADEAFNQRKKKASASESSTGPIRTRQTTNKFNNFNQRSYSEDELEKLLLGTQPK